MVTMVLAWICSAGMGFLGYRMGFVDGKREAECEHFEKKIYGEKEKE